MILGINGLIGGTLFKYLSSMQDLEVLGLMRNKKLESFFENKKIIYIDDVRDIAKLSQQIIMHRPNVVINSIGITKHKKGILPESYYHINSLFPFELLDICKVIGSRLIHISSDCVFKGDKGDYLDSDIPDSEDFYGSSKKLGELICKKSLVIRTSTIGHELLNRDGLLEWFLSQNHECNGFSNAYFSGLTTLELAKIVYKVLISEEKLIGLYNVGGPKIDKYSLLKIIADVYKLDTHIRLDDSFKIDRSLNCDRFNSILMYSPPTWIEMINAMYNFEYGI